MQTKLVQGQFGDIAFIRFYARGKYGFISFTAYTGKNYVNQAGKLVKHFVYRSTRTSDPDKARAYVERFIEGLKQSWKKEFGEPGNAPATAAPPPALGFEEEVKKVLDKLRMEKGEGSTFKNIRYQMEAFLGHMGPTYRKLLPMAHTGPEFARIARNRLQDLNSESGSPRQSLYWVRQVCKLIPGLPAECIKALRAPGGRKVRQNFSLMDSDIEAMGRNLSQATNTQRVVFWSGGVLAQHWRDFMFLKWTEVDAWRESTGSACRQKTGVPFLSFIWPELILSLNQQERQKGDVYVCKDLVWGPEELAKNPRCNQRQLTRQEEAKRADTVRYRANQVFNEFLGLCGIKRKGISYKSFRHYNASVASASVHDDAVLMDYLGLGSKKTLEIYRHSNPAQIAALGTFLRHHYLAVMRGERPTFIGCLTEAVRVLQEFIAEQNSRVRQELAQIRHDVQAMLQLVQAAPKAVALRADAGSAHEQRREAA